MDETDNPKNADKRMENGGKIFAMALEYRLSPEQLFLDPIVMPLKYMQDQVQEILAATSQFRLLYDPPCHIACGLSSISSGTTRKKLLNRIFAAMMVANSLVAIIADETE